MSLVEMGLGGEVGGVGHVRLDWAMSFVELGLSSELEVGQSGESGGGVTGW